MTLVPNPVLLTALARERQARYLASASARRNPQAGHALRVRVGRRLISLGAALSGDRLERSPSTTAGHPA